MKADILDYLDRRNVCYELESDLNKVVGEVDVIYQTRIKPERVANLPMLRRYAIDSSVLSRMKPDAMILHPLPRTVELDKTVDSDPSALVFPSSQEWTVRAYGAVNNAAGVGFICTMQDGG